MQLFWILLVFFSVLNQDFSGFTSEPEQNASPQEIALPLENNAIASEAIERFFVPAFEPTPCDPSIAIELPKANPPSPLQTQALSFYLTQHGARADLPRV